MHSGEGEGEVTGKGNEGGELVGVDCAETGWPLRLTSSLNHPAVVDEKEAIAAAAAVERGKG